MSSSDAFDANRRVDAALALAQEAQVRISLAQASLFCSIRSTLHEARTTPAVYVGSRVGADAVEFAERAAIADLAVRLQLTEATVRTYAAEADTLALALPRLWVLLLDGEVPFANARAAAQQAMLLPTELTAAFEAAIVDRARTANPARFRDHVRAVRERIVPDPAERHRAAATRRRIGVEHGPDGMSWLELHLPAHKAQTAYAHVDALARSLQRPDEDRTLMQLRADVAADLLIGTQKGNRATVSVAVTVPVLTLLGDDAPGELEGYGPIDADTARTLVGGATSFTRILTHPVTGTVLDVDRTKYTVQADLKRWLSLRDGGRCTFPGCGHPARTCELDHIIPWAHGGTTRADNLHHLCKNHHRVKHQTNWSITRTGDCTTWTSPTGHRTDSDPPPF